MNTNKKLLQDYANILSNNHVDLKTMLVNDVTNQIDEKTEINARISYKSLFNQDYFLIEVKNKKELWENCYTLAINKKNFKESFKQYVYFFADLQMKQTKDDLGFALQRGIRINGDLIVL